jgi:hypothetical protein
VSLPETQTVGVTTSENSLTPCALLCLIQTHEGLRHKIHLQLSILLENDAVTFEASVSDDPVKRLRIPEDGNPQLHRYYTLQNSLYPCASQSILTHGNPNRLQNFLRNRLYNFLRNPICLQ